MNSLFTQSEQLLKASTHWLFTRDGDPFGYALYQRHYSARIYRQPRQRLFVGPGRKMVLFTNDADAVFVWRKFKDDCVPHQDGYNCAIFRNEGDYLSSNLIKEAVEVVFEKWGPNRCYTLVNSEKVRSSNPGCCFKKAGWSKCAVSKTGKVILEFVP